MSQPLVSIIIPTFNRAHLIGETLDSVLAQTYQNWECIIVDDGSSDNTDEVVGTYTAKDPRFKYYHRPDTHKPGGNGARNYGFEMSSGAYVNWFDSDDLMLEDFLKISVENFQTLEIDFILFDYKVFNSKTGKVFIDQKNKSENLLEDYITFKINFGTWAIVWNKNFVSDTKFNEKLTKAQDLDFNFRILTSREYNYVSTNKTGLLVRGHDNSIVQDYKKNKLNSIASELYARKKVLRYILNKSNSLDVKLKCFQLYTEPLMKLFKKRKHLLILKELFSLILFYNKNFYKNILWFIQTSFYLFLNLLFKNREYRFKQSFLKYNYS